MRDSGYPLLAAIAIGIMITGAALSGVLPALADGEG